MDNIPAKFDVEIDLCGRTSDINIKDSKTYYIYSSSSDPDFVWTKKIQINGKKAAPHIFLDNVNIQVKKDAKTPAIELHGKASAYLYFINRDSKLTGGGGRAAIQKNRSEGQLCVQVMRGTTVTCQGGYSGAGIGGHRRKLGDPQYRRKSVQPGYVRSRRKYALRLSDEPIALERHHHRQGHCEVCRGRNVRQGRRLCQS